MRVPLSALGKTRLVHFAVVGCGLCVLLLGPGCPKNKDHGAGPDGGGPKAAQAADAGATVPGVVGWTKVSMRGAADDKARVLTLLNYGERLTVLEKGDTFFKVRLSDTQEGYVPARFVIAGMAQDATLLMDQDLYTRPDALSPVRKREKMGALFFVTQDLNGWRQVQLQDRVTAWVPRDKAVTEAPEVAMATALYRGEQLMGEKKPDAAAALLEEAQAAHPEARLAPLVAARLALLPRDAGVQAPAAVSQAAAPQVAGVAEDAGTPAGLTP